MLSFQAAILKKKIWKGFDNQNSVLFTSNRLWQGSTTVTTNYKSFDKICQSYSRAILRKVKKKKKLELEERQRNKLGLLYKKK